MKRLSINDASPEEWNQVATKYWLSGGDSNVANVREKMLYRAVEGFDKYKKTTERKDLDLRAWLVHAQEEAMDLAVYLERIISELDEDKNNNA